jgi:hypothetical protein
MTDVAKTFTWKMIMGEFAARNNKRSKMVGNSRSNLGYRIAARNSGTQSARDSDQHLGRPACTL